MRITTCIFLCVTTFAALHYMPTHFADMYRLDLQRELLDLEKAKLRYGQPTRQMPSPQSSHLPSLPIEI